MTFWLMDGPTITNETRKRLARYGIYLSSDTMPAHSMGDRSRPPHVTTSEDEELLANTVRLADHHRETCDGAACDISLWTLLQLLKRANIHVTPDITTRFF